MKGKIIFVDKDGKEHTKGYLIHRWDELRDDNCYEPMVEHYLESLDEIAALCRLAQETYTTWTIEDGKVVKA